MDRYTRGFILASLLYLAVGGILGLLMVLDPTSYVVQFSHVHLLLAGFMAMMVFGVGYFILPRFAGRELQWPSLVGIHFWLANVSLIVLVIAKPMALESEWPAWNGLAHAGALIQVLSFLMFTVNLGTTLLIPAKKAVAQVASEPEARPASSSPGRALPMVGPSASAPPPLGPASPVIEFVDRKAGALELLVQAGLRPLQDPGHLKMVRAKGVTLMHACQAHGIPLQELLPRLIALPDQPAGGGGPDITADLIIGDMVARHPETREVLRRRFGDGCFTCPGFATETLAQGATMHGVETEDLLAELRAAIGGGK